MIRRNLDLTLWLGKHSSKASKATHSKIDHTLNISAFCSLCVNSVNIDIAAFFSIIFFKLMYLLRVITWL